MLTAKDKTTLLTLLLLIVWWVGFPFYASFILQSDKVDLKMFNVSMIACVITHVVITLESYENILKVIKQWRNK